MYATVGGKPQTWDSQQQADVQMQLPNSINWVFGFKADLEITPVLIIQLSGIIGCFILSTTMALMIPRLVLRYHNSLISRSITPGIKSIYWGTATVCWSLSITIITLIRPYFISSITFPLAEQHYPNISYISSIVFYVVIPLEFLIISLIAVRSNRLTAVPIPAARFTSNALFCCCCCLCCCSSQARARGV